jgi:asparagine synthase (glutamine-hydrolysing)
MPVEPGILERSLDLLKHRGPDGYDVLLTGPIALGHYHFWTTPEENGERQPLTLTGLPFTIVLDGRLDNRTELASRLSISPSEEKLLSDAALILHSYARWGADCFQYFIGEYALVIYDERNAEFVCARDALGDRTLFYSLSGSLVVVASEAQAVAAADGSSGRFNESAAAHYFAQRMPRDGQTLFANVYELLPAHAMQVNVSGKRLWRYWQADLTQKIRGRSDAEYAEEFRTLLEESVRCRLRSIAQPGVLMSGGLDSTSVACLAADMLAPKPLTTISYVFDELQECDERKYIQTVVSQWNVRSLQIPCDDAWPLKNWSQWPHNPNYPEGNPYRLLKERAYARAHDEGLRVLLTGGFGDHLYSAGVDWLADLLAEGRLVEAFRELSLYVRYAGPRWTWRMGSLQRVVRRWLDAVPAGQHIKRKHVAPAWMTSFCDQQVSANPETDLGPRNNLLGFTAALSSSAEVFHTNRHGIELRHPYRDRRLVEYVLSLPTYQLYYHNSNKRVLRAAMKDILPEMIRTRLWPTSLETLFQRGLACEKDHITAALAAPSDVLRRFVRADWLSQHWDEADPTKMTDADSVVIWLCVSFLKWTNFSFGT